MASWTGIFIGGLCGTLGEPIESFLCYIFSDSGSGYSFAQFFENLLRFSMGAPFVWLGMFVFCSGFDGMGILMFPVLCLALVMILYMDVAYWNGVFLILFAQPIQMLWMETKNLSEHHYASWGLLVG